MCAGCHIAQLSFFRFLMKTGCVPCMLFSANAGGVNTHLVQEPCQWLENSFTSSQKFHMNIKKTILQWSCGNPWSWLKPSNFLSRSSLYIECLEAQKLGIKKFNRENVVELLINLGECFMLQSHVRNLIWEKRVYRKVDCCFKQTPSIAFISRPSYMGCKLSLELPLG